MADSVAQAIIDAAAERTAAIDMSQQKFRDAIAPHQAAYNDAITPHREIHYQEVETAQQVYMARIDALRASQPWPPTAGEITAAIRSRESAQNQP